MINFFILVDARVDRLRGPDQGQLPAADALHAALRHGRPRASEWSTSTFTKTPGRRRLRHRNSHDSANNPVLRTAAAGIDTGGQRPRRRLDLADNVLHALQRGAYTKGLGADLMVRGPGHSGLLRPGPPGR